MRRYTLWLGGGGCECSTLETIGVGLVFRLDPGKLRRALGMRLQADGHKYAFDLLLEAEAEAEGQAGMWPHVWRYKLTYPTDSAEGKHLTAEIVAGAVEAIEAEVQAAMNTRRSLALLVADKEEEIEF